MAVVITRNNTLGWKQPPSNGIIRLSIDGKMQVWKIQTTGELKAK
jgi:hypothetical protein